MNRKEIILHLIGELVNFSLINAPRRMVVSLHQEEDGLHLTLKDSVLRSEEEMKKLEHILNAGARPELSDYFGTMVGHDLFGTSRLEMIGWLVKHADITKTDSGTKIDLWVGNDRYDPNSFSIPKTQ